MGILATDWRARRQPRGAVGPYRSGAITHNVAVLLSCAAVVFVPSTEAANRRGR